MGEHRRDCRDRILSPRPATRDLCGRNGGSRDGGTTACSDRWLSGGLPVVCGAATSAVFILDPRSTARSPASAIGKDVRARSDCEGESPVRSGRDVGSASSRLCPGPQGSFGEANHSGRRLLQRRTDRHWFRRCVVTLRMCLSPNVSGSASRVRLARPDMMRSLGCGGRPRAA